MTAVASADVRRPSGVGWLGDVPIHWRVANIRKFATMKTGHTPSRGVPEYWENCTIPWFTLGDVWQLRDGSRKRLGDTRERISELGLANSAAELLPAGTVVLSRTASVGFPGVMPAPMATSQDFWNWVCGTELLPDYLFWTFRGMVEEFRAMMHGSTHKTIYEDAAAGIKIPVPPLAEQQRIADYLDAECSRLDRLIELRQRQQQALLERSARREYDAVLGLDEIRERVSTTVDWLPSLPVGWTLEPVQRKYEVLLGKMLAPDRVNGFHVRPYLRNANVQWGHVTTNDLLTMNFPPDEQSRYRVLPGDLLVCEGGEVGRAAVWTGQVEEIYYQKALHRVRPRSTSSVEWLYYVLRVASWLGVFTIAGTATIPHLTGEQLRAHRFPFPPNDRQAALVTELNASAAADKGARLLLERSIVLMRERKRALIMAAVTGAFDVDAASDRGL